MWMGIDGGGSTVRVVIAHADLTEVVRVTGGAVNPGSVGRETAAAEIQRMMRAALQGINASEIQAVCLGIAGASAAHSESWLREVVAAVLPQTRIVPSSDHEIALVGAHGQRQGLLLLAGTGSVALGINAAGESAQVGGWGYLIGDEGSGYWMGQEALRAVVHAADGRAAPTDLTAKVLHQLHLDSPRQLIEWLYRSNVSRTPEIAQLAGVVLETEDDTARQIIIHAADYLEAHIVALKRRLQMAQAEIAFAGGLLSSLNPLSEQLIRRFALPGLPQPHFEPVIGAVILAKETLHADRTA